MRDKLKAFTQIAVGAFLFACLAGCGRNLDVVREGKVTESMIAPNGMVEAVVSAVDAGSGGLGATMSQSYQVYLRTKRPGLDEVQVVLAAQRTNGFRLQWNKQQLSICYDKAHIFRFNNKFYVASREHGELDDVEIVLRRVAKLEDCN